MMKNQNPVLIGFVILVVGVTLISFIFGSGCGSGWIELRVGDNYVCRGESNELPPCPDPAECVREVAKLVSVEAYPVQARLEVTNQPDLADWLNPILKKLGLEEKFVILAYGRVVAGFDLKKINDGDVWTDGKRIRIQLPPPEILYEPVVDASMTQIVSESGVCPDLVCPESIELAGPVLAQAQEQMRTTSIQELKLLDRAAESARKSLEKFFRLLGYEEVEILIDWYPL
ncbi:MAG: DUF4230 domain-containing protein [Chloroflexi bacterium]|nr:MAG: DUF4230 domain-containing protein [Chloroflexota bacterium]